MSYEHDLTDYDETVTDAEFYHHLRFKYSRLGRFYRWKFRQQLSARKKFFLRGAFMGALGGAGLVMLLRVASAYPLLFLVVVAGVAIAHRRGIIDVRAIGRRVLNGDLQRS